MQRKSISANQCC